MTTNFLRELGPQVINNGYKICAIYPREKRPIGTNWQQNPIKPELINVLPEEAGIGILCGVPLRDTATALYGIDVDADDGLIIDRIETLLKAKGIKAFKRVGRAPRALFMVRGKPGLHKITSPRYKKDDRLAQVEILGTGNQFVAYGVHAQTQKAYEWGDANPFNSKASAVPLITTEIIEEIIGVFKNVAIELGYELLSGNDADSADAFARATEALDAKEVLNLPIDKIRCYLHDYKANDNSDEYGTWLRVGMALHHQFKGGLAGLQLWDEWSSTRPKYKGIGDLQAKWRSFNRSETGSSVTFRTIIKDVMASEPTLNNAKETLSAVNAMVGRAYRLLRYDWCYDKIGKRWYHYDGAHWCKAEQEDIGHAVYHALRDSLLTEYVAAGGELSTLLSRKQKKKGEELTAADKISLMIQAFDKQVSWYLNRLVELLPQLYETLWVDASIFDSNTRYFGVANGTIDLQTGKFLEPSRLHWISRFTAVAYDPQAKCPLWEKVVKTCLEDDELVSYFKRIVGYAATGCCKEQVFIILYGDGANGKTTIANALANLFDGYHWAVKQSILVGRDRSDSSSADPALVPLENRRFIVADEIKSGARLNVAQVKHITGGDRVSARGLYEEERILKPTWTIFLLTNHLPEIDDNSHGIWRRLRPIHFDHVFDEKEQDHYLLEKLKAELPGMLNWLIEGALDYWRQGEAVPNVVKADAIVYHQESDVFASFIDNRIALKVEGITATKSLYEDYLRWTRSEYAEKTQILTRHGFTSRIVQSLKDRFGKMVIKTTRRAGNTYVRGIELKPAFEEVPLASNEEAQEEVPF